MPDYSEPSDMVNHPYHYNQGKIECIDAMVSAYGTVMVTDFCLCNAFKYLWRCNDKHSPVSHSSFSEDLGKAKWYIDKALELVNKNDDDKNFKQ